MTEESGEHPDSAIARKAVSGAMWSTAAGLIARALSLVGTVLLVRFVSPADYGEVQAASILVQTASQVATLGVGAYIIAYPKAGRGVAFHATFIHVGLGILAMSLLWPLRDQLGPLFDAHQVGSFIPGLILSTILDRFSFMAERPVVRDLAFRRVSLSRTLGEIAYTTVSVYTAWKGAGAMSVVYGNMVRSAVRLLVLLLTSDWREWALPCRLQLATLKVLVPYGVVVAIESLGEFGARKWDNLVATRLFGVGVGGQYGLAYNLADLPSVQIGEQISDVLLASYAHVDPERRPAAVMRAASLMAVIMCPLSLGLGAVGPTIARAFFKPEWQLIGPFLMVLAGVLVSRPIGSVYSTYIMIVKGPKPLMYGELMVLTLLMALLVTVGRLGPLWICAMVGVAFAVRALFFMWYFQRMEGLRVTTALARLFPIFLACLPMFGAVLAVRHGLINLGVSRPVLSLLLEVAAGGLAYIAAVWMLARDVSEDFLNLVMNALRRRGLRS